MDKPNKRVNTSKLRNLPQNSYCFVIMLQFRSVRLPMQILMNIPVFHKLTLSLRMITALAACGTKWKFTVWTSGKTRRKKIEVIKQISKH